MYNKLLPYLYICTIAELSNFSNIEKVEIYYYTLIHSLFQKMPLLQANKNSTWPSQHCWNLITLQWCKNTNMVIVHCTLNKQTWMIPHFDQRVTADAKMDHTWLYVKCTIIYGHVCTHFWRSVSAFGHGTMILNKLPRPTRVRFRPQQVAVFTIWGKFQSNFHLFYENNILNLW